MFVIRLIFFAAFLSFLPHDSEASGSPNKYWLCHQTGFVGEGKKSRVSVAISRVFYSTSKNSYQLESEFELFVEKSLKANFKPEFSARCDSYSSYDDASEFFGRKMILYQERQYQVFTLNFVP